MVTNTVSPPPKRFLSDYCELCKVRGCHIESCIAHVDNPSVFDFEMSEHPNRRLDIFRKPMIKIRGYEDNILMFEYRASEGLTEYFFDEHMTIRRMGGNASELIYGMVGSIEHPYNKSDPPEVWSDRLANHNIYVYEFDNE